MHSSVLKNINNIFYDILFAICRLRNELRNRKAMSKLIHQKKTKKVWTLTKQIQSSVTKTILIPLFHEWFIFDYKLSDNKQLVSF